LRGCFVTGTDTGVGKTVLTAAVTSALRARGIDAIALKPVITGLDEPADPDWPPDHELLAAVAGAAPDEVNAVAYGPPVSPHLAAVLSALALHPEQVTRSVLAAARLHDAVIVEGVGGLLVPLCDGYDVRSLARDLALPLVIAARPGLGTINHTLLTIEAARSAELEVNAVVLTPWPQQPTEIHRSNRATIERLAGVRVYTLPRIARPDPELLAAAAGGLPLDAWLGRAAAPIGARTSSGMGIAH
jgi:dethiobiotin synthetase